MKIKQNVRVVLQSAIATFFVALIVVGITNAATTIGNNVSTGTVTATGVVTAVGVTSTGIVDITASSDTPLTVNGATSSTTLAVYNSSTGDLVNVFDGSTEVFTILDGGNVGIGDSSPTYDLDVTGLGRFTSLVDASYFVATSTTATTTLAGGFNVQSGKFVVEDDSGNVTSTGIVDITASADTILTLNGATSSTTLAVYNSSTGDLVNVFDGSTEVFTILDGGNVGIGDSSPTYDLDITGLVRATSLLDADHFVATSTTATSTFNYVSSGTGNLEVSGATNSDDLILNRYGGNVGIASTTPWGLLAVEQATETYSFIVMNQGSSTPSFVVQGVNGNGRVGIASSSPSAMLGIGDGSATTTIDTGKACFRSQTDSDTTIYWWFTGVPIGNDASFISTSTTSCF